MTSPSIENQLAELIGLMKPIAEYHERSNNEDDEEFFWSKAPEFFGASWGSLTTVRKRVSYVETIACGKRLADLLTEYPDSITEGVNVEHDAPVWETLEIDEDTVSYCPEIGAYAQEDALMKGTKSVLCTNSGQSRSSGGPFVSITVPKAYRKAATEWLEEFVSDALGRFNVLRGRILSATATGMGGLSLSIVSDAKSSPREALIMDDYIWAELELNSSVLTDRNEDLKKAGLSTRRGVLLEGDPGVGKSQLCRTFAEELNQQGCTVIHISYSVGSQQLRSVFDSAEHLGRCVFILDDIDLYLRKREHGDPGALSDFLSVMDGAARYNDILVLGTTNDVNVLDKAAIRSARFDRVLKIGNPNYGNGAKILEALLSGIGVDGIDCTAVARSFKPDAIDSGRMSITGANLQEVVRRAVMKWGIEGITTDRLISSAQENPWEPDSVVTARKTESTGQYL